MAVDNDFGMHLAPSSDDIGRHLRGNTACSTACGDHGNEVIHTRRLHPHVTHAVRACGSQKSDRSCYHRVGLLQAWFGQPQAFAVSTGGRPVAGRTGRSLVQGVVVEVAQTKTGGSRA